MKHYTGTDALAIRARMNMNQTQFWSRLGCTQSAGSRYETGRKLPKPVATLLVIAYGTEKQRQKALEALTA